MRTILFLLTLCFVNSVASAETIRLKNGKEYEGQIVEKTDDYLKLQTATDLVKIPWNMMDSDSQAVKPVLKTENKTMMDDLHDAEAYRQRGLAYEKEHNNSQAMSVYNKGIEVNPKLPSLYWNRGLLSYHMGDYDQVISDLTKYIGFKPDSKIALIIRGEAYYKKGNYDLAIADFGKAAEGQWGLKYDAYINLSLAYMKTKNYDKSWEYARKAHTQLTVVGPRSNISAVNSSEPMPLNSYSGLIKELKEQSRREE